MKNVFKISYVFVLVGLILPMSGFAAPIAAVPERATELRMRAVNNSLEAKTEKDLVERDMKKEEKTISVVQRHRKNFQAFEAARAAYRNDPELFENKKELLIRTIEGLMDHAERTSIQATRFPVISVTLLEAISEIIEADIAELKRFAELALEVENKEALSALSADIREHRAIVAEQNLRGLMLLAHIEALESKGVKKLQERSTELNKRIGKIDEGVRARSVELSSTLSENIDRQTGRITELKQLVSTGPVTFEVLKRVEGELAQLRESTLRNYNIARELISEVRSQE